VKRFRLAATYAIDTTVKSGKTRLFAAYEENVMVRKTEFESVQLHVYDTDPDTACRMVSELIRFVDLKARMLQREKTMEVVNIFKMRLAQNQRQIDSLEQFMQVLRVRYGLLDYKSQSKEVTRNYLKMVGEGASGSRLATVDSLMNNLQRKGGELLWVSDQLDQLRKDYGEVRSEYDRAMSDLTKELTYTNVVASPFPSDTKAYPVRWVIMLTVTFASVFLGFLLFIFLDKNKAAAAHGSTT
jgi:capsule polysaccharide export protein KpsE/RkpR